MYDNCQKIRFKPSNIINGEKEIHRILTNDPELILIYPPQRELILTRFWNENINDYNQLLNDFSPLINYDKVLIELRDNNSKPANYNNNPIKVVSTHAYYDNGLSAIKSDLQNISNLCHEFAHAYDAQQSKTKDENLTTILERIKPPLTKMFNLSLITFDTSPIQKIYELRDDEIFARALNQHYLRTRGDNVFANPIKPQISDYVIDYIYMNDEEFRNQINEYFMSIPGIAKWGEPEIRPVIQSKFVSDEDYKHLISALNTLTELNNQLKL